MSERPVLTDDERAAEVCELATRGRRSGERHQVEMWFATTGHTVYLVSGNGPDADWYRNALADERVEVRLGQRRFEATARPVAAVDERRLVGELMHVKHGNWAGDPDIGLTREKWLWEVPALAVELSHAIED